MSGIAALVLDLGNVLIFHDDAYLFGRLGERAGLPPDEVQRRLRQGTLWDDANRGRFTGDELRQAVCRLLQCAWDPAEMDELWSSHFRPNPPMLTWVEPLARQLRLVLLSNTNPLHLDYLRHHYPELQTFHHRLFSCEHGWIKPEREAFEAALQAAGAPPEQTAFFDDLPAYAGAARDLGIRGCTFTDAAAFERQIGEWGISLP